MTAPVDVRLGRFAVLASAKQVLSEPPLTAVEQEVIDAEVVRGERSWLHMRHPSRSGSGVAPPFVADEGVGTNAETVVKRLALVRASDVEMERVTYAWEGRIPLAKVSCIEGRMGVGKTTILTSIIAAVTSNRPLPGQAMTPTGAAILISLEDGHADTLVPRLSAAGADLTRCHLFDGYEFGGKRSGGIFSLAEDVERLRWAIVEQGAVFVAIDPFSAALGATVNSYKDQDVRRVLAPLAQLASDTGTAICFSRHFRKGGGAAEDAGGGSVGIGAACRSVLRVDADPENPDRYLLSSVKSSVSKKPATLGYRIEDVTLAGDDPICTSRIVWDGESSWSADALAAHAMSNEDRPRIVEAQEWLQAALADGSKSTKELFKAAEADGIFRRTLQRAGDALQVTKARRGFGEGAYWSLPASIRATTAPSAPSITTARMGANDIFADVDVQV